MPELPEVENVRLSLLRQGIVGQRLKQVEFLREGLRTPFPQRLSGKIKNQQVIGLQRRAKYLLFELANEANRGADAEPAIEGDKKQGGANAAKLTETPGSYLLSHLGMTGSWRLEQETHSEQSLHDHIILHFQSGLRLIYNDPRRFGVFSWLLKANLAANEWLKNLGKEPFAADFTGDFLYQVTRRRTASIKALIMDQKIVVGVGNIYASEALFRAEVKPSRPAASIKASDADRLVREIRTVLLTAIDAGGSTLRNYKNSEGKTGDFQKLFAVYGRQNEPCLKCAIKVRSKVIAGRNTYWCPKCQR